MKNVPPGSDIDGMARIVASLITGGAIKALGKDVDDLTLSFITPLSTDNRQILVHRNVYPQGSSISSRSFGIRG